MVFVLLLASILIPAAGTPVAFRSMYLVLNEDSVEVIPVGEFFNRALNTDSNVKPHAIVKYKPNRVRGPVRGLIELWITESVFVDDQCIVSRQQPLTQVQIDRAYTAILVYAKADPEMAKYRPGQPPETHFSAVLLGQTLLRLIALFGIPTIVAYIGKWIMDTEISKRHAHRRNAGLCIRCKYPCASIPSLKCPECGYFHTVPHQPPADSSDQSPA